MATAKVKMPEEFLTKLSSLGKNTDAVAERSLRQAERLWSKR